MTLGFLKSLQRDERGASAVEFAVLLPVFVAILFGIWQLAPRAMAANTMRDAVSTGANYVMAGATDPTAIQTVTLNAWTGHTASDSVSVQQYCSCAGVAGSCSGQCADGTVPQGYTQISASSTYTPTLYGQAQAMAAQQTVRTR